MQRRLWMGIVLIACMVMIASCAALPASLPVAPPRLVLPESASRPCRLSQLPANPSQADLERAYMARGADLVACDTARRMAFDLLLEERALYDLWTGSPARMRQILPGKSAKTADD